MHDEELISYIVRPGQGTPHKNVADAIKAGYRIVDVLKPACADGAAVLVLRSGREPLRPSRTVTPP